MLHKQKADPKKTLIKTSSTFQTGCTLGVLWKTAKTVPYHKLLTLNWYKDLSHAVSHSHCLLYNTAEMI